MTFVNNLKIILSVPATSLLDAIHDDIKFLNSISNIFLEIEQARLLTLKAAHMMDTLGNKIAAPEIAMIKVVAPRMCLNVVDRAIQVHGGAGLNSDLPLAGFFAWARALRFADGPDEVHLRAIARGEILKYKTSK